MNGHKCVHLLLCEHSQLDCFNWFCFYFYYINALIASKASESSAVCQQGLLNYNIWGSGSEKPLEGRDTLMSGCQGSRAPRTFQQRGPGYLGYCDSGNSSRQVLNPGIRTSCSPVFLSSTYTDLGPVLEAKMPFLLFTTWELFSWSASDVLLHVQLWCSCQL